jgi:dethiobiotin synthetase
MVAFRTRARQENMGQGIFVAGTDTGIGKTHAACALLYALRGADCTVAGMKPVASGGEATGEGLRNDDALALLAASAPPPTYDEVNPAVFAEPVSPHLAAAIAGAEIRLPPLRESYDRLVARYDWVVVEGVGGWMVPLSPSLSAAEIPRAWDLPVVLVVGMRLGCINHAQLTARAIEADGCRLVGWIANRVDPAFALPEENLVTLRSLLPAPCLGVLPFGIAPMETAGALGTAVDLLLG